MSDITPGLAPRSGTLYPLIREYVNGRVARREIIPRTGYRWKLVLNTFAENFGNRQLAMLGRKDVQRYQESIGHLAYGTRRLHLSVIRTFVKWLQLEGRIRNDPMVGITLPRPPRRLPRGLSVVEMERLRAALPDDRARLIVGLMGELGLRRIEVCRLNVEDWDPRKQTLRVTGKFLDERYLPVTENVQAALEAYVGSRPYGAMIRVESSGGRLVDCYLSQLVRRWMEDAGVKKAPGDLKACHSLRHTIASDVADVEPDIRVLQAMLGHVDLSSTQVYVRPASLPQMRAAMEAAAPVRDGGVSAKASALAADLERSVRAVHAEYADAVAAALAGDVDGVDRLIEEVGFIADRLVHVLRNVTALSGRISLAADLAPVGLAVRRMLNVDQLETQREAS